MEDAARTILDGLRRSEAWAFEAALERYGPAVTAVTASFRLSSSDADEVFQATFLSLLENRGQIRSASTLPAWIAQVARNHCLKAKRRRESPTDFETVDDAVVLAFVFPRHVDDPAMAELEFSEAQQRAVTEAMGTLDGRDTQLLHLLFAETPYSYREIADMLDVSVGSIGPLRARMLGRLRSHPRVRAVTEHIDSARRESAIREAGRETGHEPGLETERGRTA